MKKDFTSAFLDEKGFKKLNFLELLLNINSINSIILFYLLSTKEILLFLLRHSTANFKSWSIYMYIHSSCVIHCMQCLFLYFFISIFINQPGIALFVLLDCVQYNNN